jgi:predicted transcriptional regulator
MIGEIRFAFAIIAAHSFAVMSDRELVLNTVREMPETASFAEIVDELELLAEVNQGLDDTWRGAVTPHEEVVKRLETWITKSSGRTAV